MKATLVGKQHLDFEADGERIQGTKLHVVSFDQENSEDMLGSRVAAVFTKLPCQNLDIDSIIDLRYETTLGSNKARLVEIISC